MSPAASLRRACPCLPADGEEGRGVWRGSAILGVKRRCTGAASLGEASARGRLASGWEFELSPHPLAVAARLQLWLALRLLLLHPHLHEPLCLDTAEAERSERERRLQLSPGASSSSAAEEGGQGGGCPASSAPSASAKIFAGRAVGRLLEGRAERFSIKVRRAADSLSCLHFCWHALFPEGARRVFCLLSRIWETGALFCTSPRPSALVRFCASLGKKLLLLWPGRANF